MKLPFLCIIILLIGCKKNEIFLPPVADTNNLTNTQTIDFTTMKKMEGIYQLKSGNNSLGDQFVCKVSKYKISFFSNKEGIYIILNYGLNTTNGSIQFSGFWRYSEKLDQGKIQFALTAANGASGLLGGVINNILLLGTDNGNDMQMQYVRPFTTNAINKDFVVFGHHGVQTTADPPFAENSLKAVLNVEDYGANGLEFDVRLTSDHVPICIHDPSINTRLTLKGALSGKWEKYPYFLINGYISLFDGQKIPTVEQVLNTFIDSTNLTYMWFDVKGNKDIFKYLEPIIRMAYARAAAQNRKVVVFAGLPSSDVIDEYNKQPSYADLPTLCEQGIDIAINNKSKFYGPRFTEGLLLDEVKKAHTNGIKVFSWTLNDRALINSYLKNGLFDGFITDYPAYVVYDFYTMN